MCYIEDTKRETASGLPGKIKAVILNCRHYCE
jgi:hypothetical protein